jgi:endonuclease YncB( thermonuclease family)
MLARCIGLALAIAEPAGALGDAPCAGLEPGPAHSVIRVLDGETVVLDDGRELRLVGALAPRALEVDAEPGAWPPEAAAIEALRALVLGKSIELRFAHDRTDRYGRLQAQAFLLDEEGERRWIQGVLLQQGHARAYAPGGDPGCSADLLAAERPAREAQRGLWANAAYQVRSADNSAGLARYRVTFQVVEGTVIRVAQVRETIYLNFDRNWRRGFSASLRRAESGLLGAYAGNPKRLEGHGVRVRGWIEQRDGTTVIDASAGGLLEVLAPPPRPGGR